MKISGIVCEYNPFHNGHLYHIEKTRENGATHIVSVMSGSFVQRGEPAAADKFVRAQAALKGGADLVIEIPTPYVLSSAELYARGAVYLLNALGCVDEISFGSECADISRIESAAEAADRFSAGDEVKALTEKGISYPDALSRIVKEQYGDSAAQILAKPNNVLAVEYIRALRFFKSGIKPFTIGRKNADHDSARVTDGFASASHIRNMIAENGNVSGLVPDFTQEIIRDTASLENLVSIVLYRLRTADIEEIRVLPDVGQGLEYRIKEAAAECSLDTALAKIKTRRYTMARIKRILMCLIVGIKKEDLKILPPYGRILAMNRRGCEILSASKKSAAIPFGTSPAKLMECSDESRRFAEIESRATDICALAYKKARPSGTDFTAKIGVTDEI